MPENVLPPRELRRFLTGCGPEQVRLPLWLPATHNHPPALLVACTVDRATCPVPVQSLSTWPDERIFCARMADATSAYGNSTSARIAVPISTVGSVEEGTTFRSALARLLRQVVVLHSHHSRAEELLTIPHPVMVVLPGLRVRCMLVRRLLYCFRQHGCSCIMYALKRLLRS